MITALILITIAFLIFFFRPHKNNLKNLNFLPEQFIVFDLETTGLDPIKHEIIEIGAILVNRDKTKHTTFQALLKPSSRLPAKITEITGITQAMIDNEGDNPADVIPKFIEFIGSHPLITFNADFDMGFLKAAAQREMPEAKITNQVSCALKMARKAWPKRKSYKLATLAKDLKIPLKNAHRALSDAECTLMVYGLASSILKHS